MLQIPRLSKGTSQSIITIFGNIVSALFAAVSILLISRKMGPELFGEFSAGFALVLILNKLNDAGISLATHKLIGETTNKNKIIEFANSVLKIKLIISFLIILILLPLSPLISKVLNFSNPYTVIVAIVFGISIVYFEYLVSILQSIHAFSQAIAVNFMQSFLKFLFSVAYFVLPTFPSLIVLLVYIFIPFTPFLFSNKFLPKWLPLNITYSGNSASKKILSFARYTSVAVISTTIIENVGILFVQSYISAFETGILGGASRIALMISLVGVSLTQVLNPRVARYKNKDDINAYIKKAILVLLVTVVASIIVSPFSKLLITLTLGEAYSSGSTALMLLIISSFVSIATVPFAALFFSFDRKNYFSFVGLSQLTLTILGNLLFVPTIGLMGSVGTQLIVRSVTLIITLIFVVDTYKKKFVSSQINT